VLVLGLGNSILRDDGIGVHAVRRLQQLAPPSCLVIEAGTAVFDFVHLIETADRIIAFDAVEAGGQPGSVYMFGAEDAMFELRKDSLHEFGLIQVLQTLRHKPEEIVIVGAEPHIIDWGLELSPAAESAIPIMISTATKLIDHWNSEVSISP